MKIQDLLSMALRNLLSRKTRTMLTVLGVVIGATSIIIMLSLGFGLNKIQEDSIKSMGDITTLQVHQSYENIPGKKKRKLDKNAAKSFKKIEHVIAVMPTKTTSATLQSGRYQNEWANIVAIETEDMDKFNFKPEEGKLLGKNDKNSVVFGSDIITGFHDPKRPNINTDGKIKPMKSKINISLNDANENSDDPNKKNTYSEKIKVAGVLQKGNDWQMNSSVYMSMDYLKKLQKSSKITPDNKSGNEYDQINVKVDDPENVLTVQDEIKDQGYETDSMMDWIKNTKKSSLLFQAIFGGIGAISFIVAAIGISNTMIMSIYERTKEIGVMKVIGASISDIEKLFLTEAGIIGFFGGLAGVINSLLISAIMNFFAGKYYLNNMGDTADITVNPKISLIPIWLILAALLFSTMVGVLSGYLPAKRAMKLSALDAIRSE